MTASNSNNTTIGSVIVVGGGASGIHVAMELAKDKKHAVEVTVVDRQDYMDWSVASPRMLAQPDTIETTFALLSAKVVEHIGKRKDGSNHTQFVQGAVDTISPQSVTLQDGTTLTADAVVIAVGGQYKNSETNRNSIWKPLPEHTTKESRIAAFRALHAKAAQSKSIVVAGAGYAGVEIAGELKSAFPGTTVTLIGTVLARANPGYQKRVKKALVKMGVVLKEGQHLDADTPNDDGSVVTREGETISSVDLVLKATGFVFAGKELAGDQLRNDVNERGQFSCRPTLQLQSTESVFAVGDIVAVPDKCYADVKGTYHAEATAATAAHNVIAYLLQQPLQDFAWSKTPIQTPVMTALSPTVAVADMGMPFHFLENFLARKLKAGDFFVGMNRKSLGYGSTW